MLSEVFARGKRFFQIFSIAGFLGFGSGERASKSDAGIFPEKLADRKRKMSLSRVDSSRSSASRIIQREPIFFTEASFSVFAGRVSAPRTCACTGEENSRREREPDGAARPLRALGRFEPEKVDRLPDSARAVVFRIPEFVGHEQVERRVYEAVGKGLCPVGAGNLARLSVFHPVYARGGRVVFEYEVRGARGRAVRSISGENSHARDVEPLGGFGAENFSECAGLLSAARAVGYGKFHAIVSGDSGTREPRPHFGRFFFGKRAHGVGIRAAAGGGAGA